MEIKIGNYEVIANGTIIGLVDEPIIFQIENLTFEFRFFDDNDKNGQKVETEIPNDRARLILNFINFNNTLGTGNLTPFKVADYNNRDLLLSYRVYSLTDNTGKMLHYTWLLGNFVQKGGDFGQ